MQRLSFTMHRNVLYPRRHRSRRLESDPGAVDDHNFFCALLCSACSTTCCCIAVWTVESNSDFLRPICRNRLCLSGLGISRQTGFNLGTVSSGRESEVESAHLFLTIIHFFSACHLTSQHTSTCIHNSIISHSPTHYKSPVAMGEWRSSRCRIHW